MQSIGTSFAFWPQQLVTTSCHFSKRSMLCPRTIPPRTELFYQWLRRDWRALFSELRENRPVMTLPPFTVPARWSDVVITLSRYDTFRVPYAPHMDDLVGPFMLARDGAVENWRDKSVMRAILRWEDAPESVR